MMSQGGVAEKIKTVSKDIMKPEEPAKYDVIFINDNITPMDFVIRVLKTIFNKSTEEATKLTAYIHEKGKGVAGTYAFEVAEQKGIETTVLARQESYPLQVKVQKQK
jgi:ATP-dependent Clp protease adaptor protein ClpS